MTVKKKWERKPFEKSFSEMRSRPPRGPEGTGPVYRQHLALGILWHSLGLISHKVFVKLFCKRQFPHKFVNLFFILVIVKDKLTDLWGG